MNTPEDLRYTKDHEWIRVEGGVVRVGITDYAQDALGDIVYIQLPEKGRRVVLNDGISEIESTKSVNDVYAPVSGTVTEVNPLLSERPELLNTDPYGDGWICTVSDAVLDESALMTAGEYRALVGG
jgi:glycine cleavage system H protein